MIKIFGGKGKGKGEKIRPFEPYDDQIAEGEIEYAKSYLDSIKSQLDKNMNRIITRLRRIIDSIDEPSIKKNLYNIIRERIQSILPQRSLTLHDANRILIEVREYILKQIEREDHAQVNESIRKQLVNAEQEIKVIIEEILEEDKKRREEQIKREGLFEREISRRGFLRLLLGGLGGAGLVLLLEELLKRWGISLPQETPTPSQTPSPTETPSITPSPTPTLTPTPTETPIPTPTPTPEHLDLERKFFPILEELRKIPGNENLRVDWEMKTPYSGRMWSPSGDPNLAIYISYRVTGLKVIPLELLISGSWTINPDGGGWGYFKPDGRGSFDCSHKEVEAQGIFSSCRVEGDNIIVNRPDLGIQLTFVVHDRAFYNVPRWEGELPPHKKNEK